MNDKPKIERYLRRVIPLSEARAEAITKAATFTATLEEIKKALADIAYDAATLGQGQWEQIGAAVYAATSGSEDGFAAFDEWSRPWVFYKPENVRRRWDNCAAAAPTMDAGALFKLAEKAREAMAAQGEAARERIAELAKKDKLTYERERKAEAKRLSMRPTVLDELVETERRETPPPPPRPVDIDKLAASAKPITDSENVLDLLAEHIKPRLAGEVNNAKLLHLIHTTRLFPKKRQMHAVVKGLSSIGKSHLLDCTCAFIPPEDVVTFTTITEKALIYLPDDLAHKVLRMAEAAGSKERELQDYLFREMITKGRIEHLVPVKDNESGTMVTRMVVKEGPIVFTTTTTRGKLHEELETRVLEIETDDSEAQNKRVMDKIAEVEGGLVRPDDADLAPWHDHQRWLAAGECRVVVPFAKELARLTKAKSVRMRRDFGQLVRAIQAHALLHRPHRLRDEHGQILATLDDYAVVLDLMAARLAESSGLRLHKKVRETVEAVQELEGTAQEAEQETKGWRERERDLIPDRQRDRGAGGVPTSAIVKYMELDRTAVWRRLTKARLAGYLENVETRDGLEGRWRTTEQEVLDRRALPTVEQLRNAVEEPSRQAHPKTRATAQR